MGYSSSCWNYQCTECTELYFSKKLMCSCVPDRKPWHLCSAFTIIMLSFIQVSVCLVGLHYCGLICMLTVLACWKEIQGRNANDPKLRTMQQGEGRWLGNKINLCWYKSPISLNQYLLIHIFGVAKASIDWDHRNIDGDTFKCSLCFHWWWKTQLLLWTSSLIGLYHFSFSNWMQVKGVI